MYTLHYKLPSMYIEIANIGVDEKYLLLFYFTPTPTRQPKGVDEKKNSKQALGFNKGNYVISLAKLGAKLVDAV